jgi:Ca2+-binding RTX toxin-like protein
VEFFTHRGETDGRSWLKINGETVADHTGDTIGVNGAPINRIFLANPYGNVPVDILVDDIEIWDGVPTGPAPQPTAVSIGSGPDTLVLKISQDVYQSDAQYTVSVDGKQVGGTFTASAWRSSGQSDTLTIKGDWGPGAHEVEVDFLNDAYGGTAATDRNLHVEGATYNGQAVAGAAQSLLSTGAKGFAFTEAAPPPVVNNTIGIGSDTLVLKISQDAYQDAAQYTVSVDGKQVGGTFTASAWRSSGQSDTLTIKGDWGPGAHEVEVNFLNDAYGGTAATDRNLHVDGAAYNGATVDGASAALTSSGPASFAFVEAAPPAGKTLTGTSDRNVLTGGAGDDAIDGRAGRDTITGGPGHDKLTGGVGADSFVFRAGDGWDWISDFVRGSDKLRMEGVGSSDVSWYPASWSGVGNGIEVSYGGGAQGVFVLGATDLSMGDFIFG